MNIGIKSGTNEFHGTGLYSKWTRPTLWANDWLQNRQPGPVGFHLRPLGAATSAAQYGFRSL